MIWREDQIELLRSLRAQGQTFGQIATKMHTSRSAIAGMCKRQGLSGVKNRPGPTSCPKVNVPRPTASRPTLHIEFESYVQPIADLLPAPRPSHQTERQREMYEDLRKAVENTR